MTSVCLFGAAACAPAPPRPYAPVSELRVQSEDPERPFRVEAIPAGSDAVEAACNGTPCLLRLHEGGYRLHVDGLDDTPSRSRWIELEGRGAHVRISPGSQIERVGGFTMGILGPPIFGAGLFFTIGSRCGSKEDPGECSKVPPAMIVTGLVMSIAGWILWADGGTRIRDPQPIVARGAPPTGALFTF